MEAVNPAPQSVKTVVGIGKRVCVQITAEHMPQNHQQDRKALEPVQPDLPLSCHGGLPFPADAFPAAQNSGTPGSYGKSGTAAGSEQSRKSAPEG